MNGNSESCATNKSNINSELYSQQAKSKKSSMLSTTTMPNNHSHSYKQHFQQQQQQQTADINRQYHPHHHTHHHHHLQQQDTSYAVSQKRSPKYSLTLQSNKHNKKVYNLKPTLKPIDLDIVQLSLVQPCDSKIETRQIHKDDDKHKVSKTNQPNNKHQLDEDKDAAKLEQLTADKDIDVQIATVDDLTVTNNATNNLLKQQQTNRLWYH